MKKMEQENMIVRIDSVAIANTIFTVTTAITTTFTITFTIPLTLTLTITFTITTTRIAA